MGECCCGGGGNEINKDKIEDFDNFKQRVNEAVESIRPALQMDGGDVKVVNITEDGDVHVSLYGACGSCPMAQMTLKMGIERTLKEQVPEVRSVEAV